MYSLIKVFVIIATIVAILCVAVVVRDIVME